MADPIIQFSLLSGLDTRTDPHTQAVGALEQAVNVVFDKSGAVRKRHGNVAQGAQVIAGAALGTGAPAAPVGGSPMPPAFGFLSRTGEQAVAAGHRLYSYAEELGVQVSKDDYPEAVGTRRPLLSPQSPPLAGVAAATSTGFFSPDVAVSSDGSVCYVWQRETTNPGAGIGFAIYAPSIGGGGRGALAFQGTVLTGTGNQRPRIVACGTSFVICCVNAIGGTTVPAQTITPSATGWIVGPAATLATYGTAATSPCYDIVSTGAHFILCSQATGTLLLQSIAPDAAGTGTYVVASNFTIVATSTGAAVNNLALALDGAGNVWTFWTVTASILEMAINFVAGLGPVLNAQAVTFPSGGTIGGTLSYLAAAWGSGTSVYLVAWNTGLPCAFPYTVTASGAATPGGGYNLYPAIPGPDGNLVPTSRPVPYGGKLYVMHWLSSTLQGSWCWVDTNVEAPINNDDGGPAQGPRVVFTIANRLASGYVRQFGDLASCPALSPGVFATPIGVALGGASRGAPGTIQLWEAQASFTHPNRALGGQLGRATIAGTSSYDGTLMTELGFTTYPESYTATQSNSPTRSAGATISVSAGVITITNGFGFLASQVGTTVQISGCAGVTSNGTWTITSFVSSTSVVCAFTTSSASGTDANSGSILVVVGLFVGSYVYAIVWEWVSAAGELVQSTTQASATSQTLQYVSSVANTGAATITLNAFLSTSKFDSENLFASPPTLGLYRSQVGGTTLTRVASIPPTGGAYPATYLDAATDQQIASAAALYFTPGQPGTVLDNVSPPSLSHTLPALGRIWGVGDDLHTVWYSKPYVEGFQPGFNEVLTVTIEDGGELVALALINQNVVAFTASRVYITYGTGPDETGAGPPYAFQPIQTDVGCVDPRSVATIPDGLVFLSNKGLVCLGQDMSLNYLDAPEDVLAAYPTCTSAVLVPESQALRLELNNGTNGVTLVLNYWSPASPYKYRWSTFVKQDGATAGAIAVAAGYVDGYRWGAASGALYTEDTTGATYLDAGTWVTMTVQTGWISVNGVVGYQRGRRWALIGDWYTSHDLDTSTATDFDPSTTGPRGQTDAFVSTVTEGGPLDRVRVGIRYQKHQAVQVTVSDASPTGAGAVVGTGRGFSLAGLALQAKIKDGFKLLSQSRSK